MTIDEVTVAMNKALPVTVNSNYIKDMSGQFTVTAINRFHQNWSKRNVYSATITKNHKALYTVDIDSLVIESGFEDVLAGFVEQLRKSKLKACVKELIETGGNKTSIIKTIKDLIDEIKNK